MSIRASVQRALRDGTLTGASAMIDTPGIGAYLEDRLRRTFAPRGSRAPSFTVGAFWNAARTKSTARLLRMLQRALQNERGNQCVSDGTLARQAQRTYHVGDINAFGYQACVALLDDRRARGGVAYGALPAHPPRSASAKACACMDEDECRSDSKCAWNAVDRHCNPHAHNAHGFVGVVPHPDQGVHARTDAERRSVQRRGRRVPSGRSDAASRRDARRGHARSLRYSRRGSRMWRVAGPKVRLPLVA